VHGINALPAPSLHPRFVPGLAEREANTPAAQGLSWTPRSIAPRKGNGNSYNSLGNSTRNNFAAEEIIILTLQQQILAQELLIAEIELSRAIREELKLKRELQSAIDNIRRNTFRNQNNNKVYIPPHLSRPLLISLGCCRCRNHRDHR
jgi:hypothetical protein